MAFDPTTPYALACLSDNAKSIQSLTVLRQQEPAEVRVQNLVDLAESWDVEMGTEEAERVVAEYDLVLSTQAKSAGVMGSSFNSLSSLSSLSTLSTLS
jgi:hypothetical protein